MNNCLSVSNHYPCHDVRLEQCDKADCAPGYSFGPYIRDFHLLHFITGGSGVFHIGNQKYSLQKGSLFYIPPGILTFYKADVHTPWSYTWIGIRGGILPKVFAGAGLSKSHPVSTYSNRLIDLLEETYIHANTDGFDSLNTTGALYFFLDELTKCGGENAAAPTVQQTYVDTAIEYINKYIYQPVSVSELSDLLGIDRSYFCSIFKKSTGLSPQQYVMNLKMEKAKIFLETTSIDIKYIADSLGYKDLYSFSHAFKRINGVSPSDWRTNKAH